MRFKVFRNIETRTTILVDTWHLRFFAYACVLFLTLLEYEYLEQDQVLPPYDFGVLVAFGWTHLLEDYGKELLNKELQIFPQCRTIIYDGSNEGGNDGAGRLEVAHTLIKAQFSSIEKIWFLTQNAVITECTTRTYHGFLPEIYHCEVSNQLSNVLPTARFLCLGGYCRCSKLLSFTMLEHMHHLLDNDNNFLWSSDVPTFDVNPSFFNEFSPELIKVYEKFLLRLPHYLDINPSDKSKTTKLNTNLMQSGAVHIILETDMQWPTSLQRITEKTLRAIQTQRPFIIFGNYNSCKYVQNLGFETFNPLIDESYDSEAHPFSRAQIAAKEVARISNMSSIEFNNWAEEIRPICERNYKKLCNRSLHFNLFHKVGIFTLDKTAT